jgi:hypothetical protein
MLGACDHPRGGGGAGGAGAGVHGGLEIRKRKIAVIRGIQSSGIPRYNAGF